LEYNHARCSLRQSRKVQSETLPVPTKLVCGAYRSAYFKLAIAAEDESVLPHVLDMLATQGRMKYLRYVFCLCVVCELPAAFFFVCVASYV